MKYTRKDYLTKKCTHHEYYSQFVNEEYIKRIMHHFIGEDRIMRSTDPHFNDIPLSLWDRSPTPKDFRKNLKLCGDGLSTSSIVCVAKTAARIYRNQSRHE